MAPDSHHAERTFPAERDRIRDVVAFVCDSSGRAGLAPQRLKHLELAVEEAVVNVCNYAYGEGGGAVTVRVATDASRVTVEIEDAGAPFDPTAMPEPDLTGDVDERPIGGLGVHLVHTLMDEVAYRREDGRNVFTMVLKG